MRLRNLILCAAGLVVMTGAAKAQVPVIDNANLTKAQEIAQTTNQILSTDRQIMQYTQNTLQAVTGDRTSQSSPLAQMALGDGGFSMGSAPSLGTVISGGTLSFQGMGTGSQGVVSNLINSMQLVKSISGLMSGETTQMDTNYQNLVNVAGTVTGLVSSQQGAVTTRSSSFTTGAQQIGQSQDIKGSIDQNSQIMVQTGLTVNELIGAVATATAAANQTNIERIQMISQATRAMEVKPAEASR